MIRPPPRSTRTETLFPYPTLFRSGHVGVVDLMPEQGSEHQNLGCRRQLLGRCGRLAGIGFAQVEKRLRHVELCAWGDEGHALFDEAAAQCCGYAFKNQYQ